jgi:hypothetical protein
MWSFGSGGLQRSRNSHVIGLVQCGPVGISGGFGIARTRSSDRNWNVSLGSNLSTRRVRFLILKNRHTSIEPP